MEHRHKAGNIGDLLKHTWLLETVSFLNERPPANTPFRYADTFCGYKEYEVDEATARRYSYRFAPLLLSRMQEPFLRLGRYAGSVALVRALLGDNADISIFDADQKACDSFDDEKVEFLEYQSGYDVLASDYPYDLILLDPDNDVCSMAKLLIEDIARKTVDSSIILVLPCDTVEARDAMVSEANRDNVRYLLGSIDTSRKIDDDVLYYYAVFLFPARGISDNDLKKLSCRLSGITDTLNYTLNSGSIMTDIPVETECDGVLLQGRVTSVMFNSIMVEMISPYQGRKDVKYLPLMMVNGLGSPFYMVDETLQYDTIRRDAEGRLAALYLAGPC